MSEATTVVAPTPYIKLDRHFADELLVVAKMHGHDLSKGHANELVARAHGFRTQAAMRADGLMVLDRYARDDFGFDVERVRVLAIELKSVVAHDFEPIAQSLKALCNEARNPDTALAARLARNVCLNADWSTEFGEFAGRTLLSPHDYAACVEVTMRDDFEDNLWVNVLGIPTIAALAQTEKILPQDHGYHAINADFVLNVAMYLAGARVEELVERYRVVCET
ncbi:hypothetical protein [Paraburkholderia phenazinium]|jgi:hypothetical protein|uniref:Uncharacterized protein n=1 Tax=Paraburkholderia phenazinium TaxID=60549 RepID=A0A1N6EPR5_9BURK|nr:hypothetical protein [Paraburkholderia phenazinium]SIN84967.1 hypothetical protein SAMN05444168_0857 [Paraburkholderia phenazinium]